VCSVRGLYCAFPPLDPPVYVRPQLKPPCGICSFTTTTFRAHRGVDQGAGTSTSGRGLLHLLGGSTSASPPSTADLLQLPGLTSTRPGWHTTVPNLHQHIRAGIFFPGPAYLCPGQHMRARGRLWHSPGRHICVPAGIYVGGPDYFNSGLFWPEIAGSGPA
jgi:hypothetical protein